MPFMYSENCSTAEPSRSATPISSSLTPNDATLYPKITNHIHDVVKILKQLHRGNGELAQQVVLDPIPIFGSVKLHGTHADILVHADDRITFQSRNIAGLQTSKDNAGFVSAMSRKTKVLFRLRDVILARFRYLNPGTPVDPCHPVLIAGEWIGENIQKHVAIAQLSKRFVIVSVNINGQWQRDSDYGGISLPNHNIYNALRAGIFRMTLYPEDPARTAQELEPLAEQVANHCPFAETFGLKGEGEGIVWKLAPWQYNGNSALWFKTKGGRFKPTFAPPPRQSPEAGERNREAAADVSRIWCSEQRMMQGIEYLNEMHVTRDMRGLSKFLKWVQNDILVEEMGFVRDHAIDVASLKIEIAKIAKPWYVARLETRC